MKFYCEENKTFYDTPEECAAAEQAILEARAAKDLEKEEDEKTFLEVVDNLHTLLEEQKKIDKEVAAARELYYRHRNNFINKYHTLPKGVDESTLFTNSFWSIFVS